MRWIPTVLIFIAALSASAAPADSVKLGAIPTTNVVHGSNFFLMQQSSTTGGVARLVALSNIVQIGRTLIVDISRGDDSTAARESEFAVFRGISNALAAAQNGDQVIVRPGNYTNAPIIIGVDAQDMTIAAKSPLKIVRKTNMVVRFEGRPKIWSGGVSVGEYLTIENSSHITIEGLWIEGSREPEAMSSNGYSAILLRGTNDNLTFRNIAIRNISAQGICNFWNGYASNVVVTDSYFFNVGSTNCDFDLNGSGGNNGPDGAAVAGRGGSGWSLRNNLFEFCLRGVEFDPNLGHHMTDCEIVGNRFLRAREYALLMTGYASSPTLRIARLKVQGNTFTHSLDFEVPNGSAAMALFSLQDALIQDNITSGFSMGIDAQHYNANAVFPVTNVVVTGNRIHNTALNGMRIVDHPSQAGYLEGWLINDNHVGPCGQSGIVASGNQFTISNNKIVNCPSPILGAEHAGIFCQTASGTYSPATNINIIGNEVFGTSSIEHGIRIDTGTVGAFIEGNSIRSNSLPSIRIASGVTVNGKGNFCDWGITVNLLADNQVVNLSGRSYVKLSSDNATAGNRTFVLTSTNILTGQQVIMEWTGTNAGELVDDAALSGGGTARLSSTWTPTQYDILVLQYNGTDFVEQYRSVN